MSSNINANSQLNQLYLGDALQWLKTLSDSSSDAVITDPPYASGGLTTSQRQQLPSAKYVTNGQAKQWLDFQGDNKDQRSHLHWSLLWLEEAYRILKDGSIICVFSDWRQLPLTTDALQMSGFIWRGVVVWDKTEATRPQLGRFRHQAEYIVWASKGKLPTKRDAPVLPGVMRFPVKQSDKFHMTGKPTDLMRKLVQICEAGGVIVDPFAGSGTTLVAAQAEGFSFLGCEKNNAYYEVAQQRIQQQYN